MARVEATTPVSLPSPPSPSFHFDSLHLRLFLYVKKTYVSLLSVRAVEARNLLDQLENKKQKKKKKMEKNGEKEMRVGGKR